MSKAHLSAIGRIDTVCFGRKSERTRENLEALLETSSGGAYVSLDGVEVTGYVFTRVLGKTAYIGPLGVDPGAQNRGVGRQLMNAAMQFLKPQCSTLGLEMRPESGKNIGLYQSLGFVTGFPSIDYVFPESIDMPQDTGVTICELVSEPDEILVDQISAASDIHFDGTDYGAELRWAMNRQRGTVLVATASGSAIGFLANVPDLLPMAWGAIIPAQNDEGVMLALLAEMARLTQPTTPVLRVNTAHQRIHRLLVGKRFRSLRSCNRMFLQDYLEGQMCTKHPLVIRAWIG